jgi:plasmid stability protein
MADILVRDVDPSVIERLKRKAAAEHTSLAAVAREALTAFAKPTRAEVFAAMDAIARRIGPVPGDSTDLIREDRDNDEPYR